MVKKNFGKKVLAVFLSVFLLIPAILSWADTNKYVAFGDSISKGYGLPDGKSYVDLYNGNIKAKEFKNYSENGYTTKSVLDQITNNNSFVAGSDVVTICVGSNNLLEPTMIAVGGKFNKSKDDISGIQAAIAKNPVLASLKLASLVTDKTFLSSLDQGVAQFATEFQSIITNIKSISPKATIYVNNVYNPFRTTDIFYSTYEARIQKINRIINDTAARNGFKVVDVYSLVKKNPNLINFNLLAGRLDPHPTEAGQVAIYNALIAVSK